MKFRESDKAGRLEMRNMFDGSMSWKKKDIFLPLPGGTDISEFAVAGPVSKGRCSFPPLRIYTRNFILLL
jgi:hypothetical protein